MAVVAAARRTGVEPASRVVNDAEFCVLPCGPHFIITFHIAPRKARRSIHGGLAGLAATATAAGSDSGSPPRAAGSHACSAPWRLVTGSTRVCGRATNTLIHGRGEARRVLTLSGRHRGRRCAAANSLRLKLVASWLRWSPCWPRWSPRDAAGSPCWSRLLRRWLR
jgi:hypothetical protein